MLPGPTEEPKDGGKERRQGEAISTLPFFSLIHNCIFIILKVWKYGYLNILEDLQEQFKCTHKPYKIAQLQEVVVKNDKKENYIKL